MNIRKLRLLTTIVSLLIILVFLVTGCKGEVASEGVARKEVAVEEKPDEELFNKYFSSIQLGKNILLPHQETWLEAGIKIRRNFILKISVLNLETNDFIERCATIASSEGSDGIIMEALEWAFLRPGNYEYRVYVEKTCSGDTV